MAAEASIRILFIIIARDEQNARKVQNLLSDRRSPSSVVTSPLACARARVATSSLARARAVICTVRCIDQEAQHNLVATSSLALSSLALASVATSSLALSSLALASVATSSLALSYCTKGESLLDCCVCLRHYRTEQAEQTDMLNAEMQSVQAEPAKRLLSVTAVVKGEVRTVH
jgi:hypothetical protein